MTTLTVKLPALLPAQKEIYASPARFRVLAAGRRWGKTRLAILLAFEAALRGGAAWWVAPSYLLANVGWRGLTKLSAQIPQAVVYKAERRIEFPSGGWIQIRSAADPQALRSEGLDFVALDECAFMQESVWTDALRPALADRQGKAIFISTPFGRNWFWRLYQRGLEDGVTWRSWTFPSSANPRLAEQELEEARKTMPEAVFRREFLAEFVDFGGAVFRRVLDAATAEWQPEPQSGRQYVFGVDWGRSGDYTVIAVLDITSKSIVYYDRFTNVDAVAQIARVRALAERFRPSVVVVETNAIGAAMFDMLQRTNVFLYPFHTTHATKLRLIDDLALAFESGAIRVPPDRALLTEFEAYEVQKRASGAFSYSAPSGGHDDIVMAVALAWHALAIRPQEAAGLYA